jgi:Ca-activated chloride channel family protein
MKKSTLLIAAIVIALSGCQKAAYGSFESSYHKSDGAMMEGAEPPGGDRFSDIVENPFMDAAENPLSTFSVDADGAAYAYMRRCIREKGFRPDANSVRIEEYLNYFTFNYEDPKAGEDVALNAEVGPCPWNEEHYLLRLGIKGKSLEEESIPQANFVFLIDVSGSMSSTDKLPLLKQSLITMLDYMRSDDRIAIVTYASGEKLLLGSTPASEKTKIVNAIKQLYASGSTSGARAMEMAYQEALKNFLPEGNNRIIMGTDGDFNVGPTSTEAIKEMVQNYASQGVYITLCGFGTGNLNDAMMEEVSNAGNGTYQYIDSEDEMTKVFVNERARFITVANDCKTQIAFNPEAVSKYRLIGYENRMMANEDFENDKADAAEIGMGQTITALYEIIPAENAQGSLGTFSFRYKKTLADETAIPLSIDLPAFGGKSSENLLFASSLAAWGLTLRNSQYKGNASIEMAIELAKQSLNYDPFHYRQQYLELLQKAAKY